MALHYLTGNLLDSQAKSIVNTVNCVGVMGKGLAKQFKDRFPNNFQQYKTACTNNQVQIGKLFCTYDHESKRTIINFPTKKHWQNPSQLEWIEQGLKALRNYLENMGTSIAIPPLGCGNGGLDWRTQVQPLVHHYLADLDMDIEIYAPEADMTQHTEGLRILVTGGREYNNFKAVSLVLSNLSPVEIIHGAARGADTLAGQYAKGLRIPITEYPAQWDKHGKAAGPIRNEHMLLDSTPDIVVAFSGDKGTNHMKNIAHKHGYPVLLGNDDGTITYDTRIHNMRTSRNLCPDGFIRVDRATQWGNNNHGEREVVIAQFETDLRQRIIDDPTVTQLLAKLAGRTLACWCSPEPCHANILKYYAEHYAMAAWPTPAKILGFQ